MLWNSLTPDEKTYIFQTIFLTLKPYMIDETQIHFNQEANDDKLFIIIDVNNIQLTQQIKDICHSLDLLHFGPTFLFVSEKFQGNVKIIKNIWRMTLMSPFDYEREINNLQDVIESNSSNKRGLVFPFPQESIEYCHQRIQQLKDQLLQCAFPLNLSCHVLK